MAHADALAEEALLVHREGLITHIVLNRPDRGNSLSIELVRALHETVDACAADGTAVMTLRGAGRHFCTGFDLRDSQAESEDALLGRFIRIELCLQAVHSAPFVTVAIVNGRAIGAGADLVAACEHRWCIRGNGEVFFAFPGAGFGVILGTARLARLVGAERVRAWVRSGGVVSTQEALHCGLLRREVSEPELGDTLKGLVREVTRLDKPTLHSVHAVTRPNQDAEDLYQLAASCARPGLAKRIADYRRAASN